MKTLVFDTETTGLVGCSLKNVDHQPYIIEFFGLSFTDGFENESFHSFFKPPIKLPETITKLTGITDEQLISAPAFSSESKALKKFIESHDEVVAHNASFDKAIIGFEMERCGQEISWPRLICTVEASEFLKGYRLTLSDLHETLFGEKFNGAHRAENDVRALSRCFFKMGEMGIV